MQEGQNRSFLLLNTLITGFFGGVFFSSLHIVSHYFHLTKVDHIQILQFFHLDFFWVKRWYGYLFFIIFSGFLSIVFALLYYFIAKQLHGWIYGAIYGLLLWLVFVLLIPAMMKTVTFPDFLKTYMNVYYLCSFLIYGIFIGYSISYDYEMSKQYIQNG